MFFDPPDDSPLATSVPCVVELSIGGGAETRFYGPFPSLLDARDWCARQSVHHFMVIPLRRTDIERDYHQWYDPQLDNIEMLVSDFCDLNLFREWQETQ